MADKPMFSGNDLLGLTDQPASTKPSRAPCGTCGFPSVLDAAGLVLDHFQERIRAGADGEPERYTTATPCDGAGEEPETSN
jgi:hypothetical protein